MRYQWIKSERDSSTGKALAGATVTVYKAGLVTPAVIYASLTAGTPITNSQITTDSNGVYSFFVDSADYSAYQRFGLTIQLSGYTTVNYDNLHIIGNTFDDLLTKGPYVDLRAFLPSGFKSDGSVDYTTQIASAAAYAVASGARLYLPPGTWMESSVLRTSAEIFGESPAKSILYNSGTGNALDLGPAGYYSLYENFQVKGNANSMDGITLYTTVGDNPAYMQFNNVWSTYNGRHGLYHRNAWATKYRGCKFHYNSGLGIYLITLSGDPGTANGVSFIQCESRWNGGALTTTTFADAKGGVSINGASAVSFIGGVYESNNAWQFLLGQSTVQSMQSISIEAVYIEGRPPGTATIGGAIYINYGGNIIVKNCEIGFGAGAGNTSYAFYIGTGGVGTIEERGNNYAGGGAGTQLYINSGAKLSRTPVDVVTVTMGDTGSGGTGVTQTLLTASTDGAYQITGFIRAGRNSELGGLFPFVASYNSTTGKTVTVGASIAGTATTAPTMAWNGNNLQITFAGYHIGFVKFSYSQTSMPTIFTLNSAYISRNDNLPNLSF